MQPAKSDRRHLRLPSLVAFQDRRLTRAFRRCGLVSRTVSADPQTSIHLWSPAARHPARPSLVLVHGFGGNTKWQWQRQIGPLSRSFDLYVPDLVFFGESRTDSNDRSVGFQARCVAEALRQLGVERYSVAAISYGGFVAFRMAEMAPGVVERVVILTSGICFTAEQRRERERNGGRDVGRMLIPQRPKDLVALLRWSMYRPPRWIPSFLLRDAIEVMYKDWRKERGELLKELLDHGAGLEPLPVLKQDTLIIWGDQDQVFPINLGYQLQSHLGAKSRLEVIKDAGHALLAEKPGHCTRLIKGFLLDANDAKSI